MLRDCGMLRDSGRQNGLCLWAMGARAGMLSDSGKQNGL